MNEALVLLILFWAAVLLPMAARSARRPSPHTTVGGFERTMEVLSRDGLVPGRQVYVPAQADRVVQHAVSEAPITGRTRQEDPVIARRRTRFLRLLAATGASLLLGLLFGGWLWLPAVATLGATATSVVVLRRLKLQRDRAREVVRDIDLREDATVVLPEAVAVGGDGWGSSGAIRLRRWDG